MIFSAGRKGPGSEDENVLKNNDKFELTTPNMSQHIMSGWPNTCNMLCPTVFQYHAINCGNLVVGALRLELTGLCEAKQLY